MLFKESLAQWTPERKDGSLNSEGTVFSSSMIASGIGKADKPTLNIVSLIVLSKDFVEGAVRLLVTRFIPLKVADLEGWQEDPEDWVNHEERDNDMWEFEIRVRALGDCLIKLELTALPRSPVRNACSWSLLNNTMCMLCLCSSTSSKRSSVCTLLTSYSPPMLICCVAKPAVTLADILQREAVYCALGRTCHRMRAVIPFGTWLSSTLVPEARSTNPQYPLIKRRIAWLVGKWTMVDEGTIDGQVWELLVWLLQDRGPGTDAVVRLTAAVALKECLDVCDSHSLSFVRLTIDFINGRRRPHSTLTSLRRTSRSQSTSS